MGTGDHHRISEIFLAACELDPERRGEFLDHACEGQPEVRARVESMLAHDSSATSGLRPEAIRAAIPGLLGSSSDPDPLQEIPSRLEDHPVQVGPYRILKILGEGGMGVVFLVNQEEPIRRQLALKIIKLGMDTREVVARFELERQALAILDHPNIARVIDAGATGDGRPFFAMDYVQGTSITQYCDANRLNTSERLELFIPVCQAIQHAHRKGIIHRDIKPSNILVPLQDGRPVPKIIDFGVAKAIGLHLTDKTLATRNDLMIGTPGYMSPEQAEMGGRNIDITTDIYSLGVVLYELLSGARPFDLGHLQKTSFDEMRRIIREEDPLKPSTRVSLPGAASGAAAEKRRSTPAALSRLLRGELDWITMKAMDKEPSRRYQSAAELMLDVQRYLRQQPVLAGPPGSVYRLRKRLGRHKVGVAVVVGLVAFVVAVSLGIFVSKRGSPPDATASPSVGRAARVTPVHRQLTFTGTVDSVEVSPDGEAVAYVTGAEEQGERLLVQDLAWGKPQEILQAFAIMRFRWSPDGTELLVSAQAGPQEEVTYLIPRRGGVPRQLPPAVYVAWSPDGQSYAYAYINSSEIGIRDISTGSMAAVPVDGSFTWILGLDWSSTDLLAFITSGEDNPHAIWTIPSGGGKQNKLLDESDKINSLRWTGDGTTLYYLVGRKDASDLLKIGVDPETGTATSGPETILTGLEAFEFSLAWAGKRIVFSKRTLHVNLWQAIIRAGLNNRHIETTVLTPGTVRDIGPAVSPDRRQVAFVRNDNIWVVRLKDHSTRQLTFTSARRGMPAWSPDGSWIAFGSDEGGPIRVWRIPSAGGTAEVFEQTRLSVSLSVTWAPGSRILYQTPGNRNFQILEPSTGEQALLVKDDSVGWTFAPRWTPDGERVAVAWNRRQPEGKFRANLWTVSLVDSVEKRIYKDQSFPAGWSADGESVYAWDLGSSSAIKIPAGNSGEVKTLFEWPFDGEPWPLGPACVPISGEARWVCTVIDSTADAWLIDKFDAHER